MCHGVKLRKFSFCVKLFFFVFLRVLGGGVGWGCGVEGWGVGGLGVGVKRLGDASWWNVQQAASAVMC